MREKTLFVTNVADNDDDVMSLWVIAPGEERGGPCTPGDITNFTKHDVTVQSFYYY